MTICACDQINLIFAILPSSSKLLFQIIDYVSTTFKNLWNDIHRKIRYCIKEETTMVIHGTSIAPHSPIPPEAYRYAKYISIRGKGIIEIEQELRHEKTFYCSNPSHTCHYWRIC